ncbi:MAG: ACT domain-containing protein [Planctomycetota bacterium]
MKPEALTEFSIYLDQRPGELAGVLDAAGAAGVEVESFSVSEHNGRGLIRLIGEPVEALRAVCESMTDSGVGPIVESGVLAVRVDDRPSAMRDLTTAMADRRINVRYAYMSPGRVDGQVVTRCVFRVDDLEGVLAEIEAIDWPGEGHLNGSDEGEG